MGRKFDRQTHAHRLPARGRLSQPRPSVPTPLLLLAPFLHHRPPPPCTSSALALHASPHVAFPNLVRSFPHPRRWAALGCHLGRRQHEPGCRLLHRPAGDPPAVLARVGLDLVVFGRPAAHLGRRARCRRQAEASGAEAKEGCPYARTSVVVRALIGLAAAGPGRPDRRSTSTATPQLTGPVFPSSRRRRRLSSSSPRSRRRPRRRRC